MSHGDSDYNEPLLMPSPTKLVHGFIQGALGRKSSARDSLHSGTTESEAGSEHESNATSVDDPEYIQPTSGPAKTLAIPKEIRVRSVPPSRIESLFVDYIRKEKPQLDRFYPTQNGKSEKLASLAERAAGMAEELQKDGCSYEMALQFTRLSLYNLFVLLDDSSTIVDFEDGARKETLQQVLYQAAKIYTHARPEGIEMVRFFNTNKRLKDCTPEKVPKLFEKLDFNGCETRIGTELRRKILDPQLYNKKNGAVDMQKPLLVLVLTDGGVEGEAHHALESEITQVVSFIQKNERFGHNAVAFQFARVGDDEKAEQLIKSLDNHPQLGSWIDCFPAEDNLEKLIHQDHTALPEEQEAARWQVLRKLMLGPLYRAIDLDDTTAKEKDRKRANNETPAVAPVATGEDSDDEDIEL